jgi:hypothetical protein
LNTVPMLFLVCLYGSLFFKPRFFQKNF